MWKRVAIVTGVVLLLLGLQLRVCHSYQLTPQTTATLARWLAPKQPTAESVVQRVVVETTAVQKTIRPPRWLGWALLSFGVVLTSHGVLRHWRR